jgi:hypothetical protein
MIIELCCSTDPKYFGPLVRLFSRRVSYLSSGVNITPDDIFRRHTWAVSYWIVPSLDPTAYPGVISMRHILAGLDESTLYKLKEYQLVDLLTSEKP